MTEKEKIENQLAHQANLIIQIIVSLEFLINYPKYLKKTGNDKSKALGFIYNLIRDNTILNVWKLFNGRESYSFESLKKELFKVYEKDSPEVQKFFVISKKGNKKFNQLDILKIRNTHVAHLDHTRIKKSINWNEVKELVGVACEIHDYVNSLVFKTQCCWLLDQKLLNTLFIKDLAFLNLTRSWRKMHWKQKKELSMEEVTGIVKTNWS